MTRSIAVCVCLLLLSAGTASGQSGTTGASASTVSSAQAMAGSSARSSFSGTASASHKVRIRIRPHTRLVSAGSHVIRDNRTGADQSIDAVRLYTNLPDSKLIVTDMWRPAGIALAQQASNVLYASRGISPAGKHHDAGRLFLVNQGSLAGSRYVTVTDL